MNHKGFAIRRILRETQFGRYYVYGIYDKENTLLETTVTSDVAKHVIDAKLALGQWNNAED